MTQSQLESIAFGMIDYTRRRPRKKLRGTIEVSIIIGARVSIGRLQWGFIFSRRDNLEGFPVLIMRILGKMSAKQIIHTNYEAPPYH